MDELVASTAEHNFQIEYLLENQIGTIPTPFLMMDKSMSSTCVSFTKNGYCPLKQRCPYRHIRPDKDVVCKHWLRGLCKKGDDCEFMHVYDTSKMPECYFHSKLNSCTNKECTFLHVDQTDERQECPWYNRGFCKRGPECRLKHIRRILCLNYLCGFCPDGARCNGYHGKFYVDLRLFKNMLK